MLDDRLGLDRVRGHIAALPRADRWQTEARAALRDDFYESQLGAHRGRLHARPTRAATPDERVDAWLAAHACRRSTATRTLVADVERAGVFDLATLAVVRRALRELAALD